MEELKKILMDKLDNENVCDLILVRAIDCTGFGENKFLLQQKIEKEIYGAAQEKLRELSKEETNFLAKHCEDNEKLMGEFVAKLYPTYFYESEKFVREYYKDKNLIEELENTLERFLYMKASIHHFKELHVMSKMYNEELHEALDNLYEHLEMTGDDYLFDQPIWAFVSFCMKPTQHNLNNICVLLSIFIGEYELLDGYFENKEKVDKFVEWCTNGEDISWFIDINERKKEAIEFMGKYT